jgi:hypothetical protein
MLFKIVCKNKLHKIFLIKIKIYGFWRKKMLKWKDNWKYLENTEEEDVVDDCGVYKIRLFDLVKNKPKEIPRFCKNDKDGILMIGHSKNVIYRIKSFKREWEDNKGSQKEKDYIL